MRQFLFRLDMAKENEQFLAIRQGRGVDQVYSGTPMKVGPGWIPDFFELAIERDANVLSLTLIELEATDIVARASCRKYLPEPSSKILDVFIGYLDTVISQCRSTADARLNDFGDLRSLVAEGRQISVRTAGALRTSAELIEDYPLIDQPERASAAAVGSAEAPSSFSFDGERRLTRSESDGLRRAVRFLHAVIVGRDHSGGLLRSWGNLHNKPLDDDVERDQTTYPLLHSLITAKTVHGLRVDCDGLAAELAALWSVKGSETITAERVAGIISTFAPVAAAFPLHESMENIFSQAREALRATAS